MRVVEVREKTVPISSSIGIVTSPFLLPITWLPVGLGINKFNTLESRQDAAREAFLTRCDNASRSAPPGRHSRSA
jgi:hypothetical protein